MSFATGKIFKSSGSRDNVLTPKTFYDLLDAEFHFDHDPCPPTPAGLRPFDGLGDWPGRSVFVNPPYSNPRPWIQRAVEESAKGKTVVMLLRADTSTRWFHDLILPNAEVRFVRGRLQFKQGKPAPFASLVCIFKRSGALK